jgi:hypothetical protein
MRLPPKQIGADTREPGPLSPRPAANGRAQIPDAPTVPRQRSCSLGCAGEPGHIAPADDRVSRSLSALTG